VLFEPGPPHHTSNVALIDHSPGRRVTYAELEQATQERISELGLRDQRQLVFLFTRNAPDTVVSYLAALRTRSPVALLDADLNPRMALALIEAYQPDRVLGLPDSLLGSSLAGFKTAGPSSWVRSHPLDQPIHPDLALLLSTSGSTGSPKFVRLSARALEHNAQKIRRGLMLTEAERPVTSLRLHYTFGLSVLNSHLLTGSTLVMVQDDITTDTFWSAVRSHQCTGFAGVPYSYQVVRRLGLDRLEVPSLECLIQAGGKLADDYVAHFSELMRRRGGRFYVMYGQTEATARITILPTEMLPEKLGSAGLPLEDGRLRIVDADGHDLPPGEPGEVVYEGPNVMMGYAESRADLARPDEQGGVLQTGDLGYLDEDGYLYITGRSRRMAKVFGHRISLVEVEALLSRWGHVGAISRDDRLLVFVESDRREMEREISQYLATELGLHASGIVVRVVHHLPVNERHKVDYRALEQM
jgi:acyl-coenzyme A synthetase/AMP-(fatty) acid ligase